jgi:divalent metal cation (Fe/Co/Zn/Cd) transporter
MENLASGLAIYISLQSYEQLINPHPIDAPIIGIILALIAAVISLTLGFIKYPNGKESKMGSVKLEAFNTIKDGGTSGLTVVALILSLLGGFLLLMQSLASSSPVSSFLLECLLLNLFFQR